MEKKGVSMIMLVVTILVVLVLTTAVTTSYTVVINSTKMREFGNELNQIQKAVDEYNFLNNEYPVKDEYTLNLELVDKLSLQEQFGKLTGIMDFYIIDFKKLGINELKRGIPSNIDNLDVYAISKENGNVYYLAGVNINKKIYYTLVDEIREKLDI